MKRPVRTTLLSCTLGLAALTGCGGDDALSKDDYLAQSERICSAANDALEAEPELEGTDLGPLVPFFEMQIQTADRATSDLEDLAAEQPDADELERIFLDPLRAQVDALQDFLPQVRDAVEGGTEAFAELEEPELPEPAPDLDAMRDYGFDDCVTTAEAE